MPTAAEAIIAIGATAALLAAFAAVIIAFERRSLSQKEAQKQARDWSRPTARAVGGADGTSDGVSTTSA